ncbi:uncharacterized [Tachysurus ichikawai]
MAVRFWHSQLAAEACGCSQKQIGDGATDTRPAKHLLLAEGRKGKTSKRDGPHEDKPAMSQQDLLIVATGLEIICHSAALKIDSLDCGRESGKLRHLNCHLLSLAVGGWEDQTA